MIEVGPLNRTIHSVDELVAVEDLDRLERIYFRIAELLLVEGERDQELAIDVELRLAPGAIADAHRR